MSISVLQDGQFMEEAIRLAEQALPLGEVPVGAIVVRNSDGAVLGRGFNRRETGRSALLHAEMNAIAQACEAQGNWRLHGCTLFVTLEPCPMCAGAIINARIDRVVYGAADPKAGCCESVINLFEFPFNHRPALTAGVLQDRCAALLERFFGSLR